MILGNSRKKRSKNHFVSILLSAVLMGVGIGVPIQVIHSAPAVAATVPTNPSNLSASCCSADDKITVSFTAPNDGGSPITNYKWSLDEITWNTYSPAVGAVSSVTLLIDMGPYPYAQQTLYFKAVNSIGDSTSSGDVTNSVRSIVSFTGGGQPGAPS